MRGVPKPLLWKDVKKLFQKITDNRSHTVEHRGKTRLEAFWMCVDVKDKDECWEWLGYTRNGGYGVFRIGEQHRVHRLMWIIHNEDDILHGEMILHKCGNSSCANPYHLYKGDQSDNMQDRERHGTMPDEWYENASKRLREWWANIPKEERRQHIEDGTVLQ